MHNPPGNCLVIIASLDWIAGQPDPLIAVNINTLARSGGDAPIELGHVHQVLQAIGNRDQWCAFVITNDQKPTRLARNPVSLEAESKTPDKIQQLQTRRERLQNKVRNSIKTIFHLKIETDAVPNDSLVTLPIGDSGDIFINAPNVPNADLQGPRASAIIAGLSQKGHPIATWLGLSQFFRLDLNTLRDSGGKWLVICPSLGGSPPLAVDPQGRNGVCEYVDLVYDFAGRSVRLRINAIVCNPRDNEDKVMLSQPFLKPSSKAAPKVNWRARLPQQIGRYLDLFYIGCVFRSRNSGADEAGHPTGTDLTHLLRLAISDRLCGDAVYDEPWARYLDRGSCTCICHKEEFASAFSTALQGRWITSRFSDKNGNKEKDKGEWLRKAIQYLFHADPSKFDVPIKECAKRLEWRDLFALHWVLCDESILRDAFSRYFTAKPTPPTEEEISRTRANLERGLQEAGGTLLDVVHRHLTPPTLTLPDSFVGYADERKEIADYLTTVIEKRMANATAMFAADPKYAPDKENPVTAVFSENGKALREMLPTLFLEENSRLSLWIDEVQTGRFVSRRTGTGETPGGEEPSPWTLLPRPILVPLPTPTADVYDLKAHSGLMILARRLCKDNAEHAKNTEVEKRADEWRILNVGEEVVNGQKSWTPQPETERLRQRTGEPTDFMHDDFPGSGHWKEKEEGKEKGETNPLADLSIAPWQIAQINGIWQTTLEYNGRPLGVRLWEEFFDDTTGTDYSEIWQILCLNNFRGWGRVPGLRYGTEWVYEFLFVPIHNSGALPPLFRLNDAAPAELADRTTVASEIEKWEKDSSKTLPKFKLDRYLRTVPVGQIRIDALPSQGGSGAEDGNSHGKADQIIYLQGIPQDVRPICADLWATGAHCYEKDTSQTPDPTGVTLRNAADRPACPPQCVLLWDWDDKTGDRKLAQKSFSFRLRPPATSLENWTIWQSSVLPNDDRSLDFIADVNRLVRELRSSRNFDSSSNPDDLLDDPAVHGVWVTRRVIHPVGDKSESLFLAFGESTENAPKLYQPYNSQFTADLPANQPLDSKNRGKLRDAVQRFARKDSNTKEEILQISNTGKDPSFWQVVRGTVVEYSFTPFTNHDALFVESPTPKKENVFRLWVEAVPDERQWQPGDPDTVPKASWDALVLKQVEEHKHKMGLAVQLNASKLSAIAAEFPSWIGWAIAEIQPWVWRGRPEWPSGKDHPFPLLRDSDPKESDEDSVKRYKQAVKAEIAAFSDREDAAALSSGEIPIAAVTKHAPDGKKPTEESITLYEDREPRGPDPKYYRVRLILRSRYHGLGRGHAHEHVSTFKKNDFITQHKRILLKGKLTYKLEPPRVKMVLPLIEPVGQRESGNRPGFLVLTRDTLRSPFHRLRASIDEAERDNKTLEIGFDPITSREGGVKLPENDPELYGQAIGLTYEREAEWPMFPNAQFLFECPWEVDKDKNKEHDFFVKLRFRWEILPSKVVDVEFETQEGKKGDSNSPYTQPWEVRLLGHHQWFGSTSDVQFSIGKKSETLVFHEPNNAQKPVDVLFPKPSDKGKDLTKDPVTVALFIAWALVPDFLTSEKSKAIHSIWWLGNGNTSNRIYANPTHSNMTPYAGNFVQLFLHPSAADKPGPKNLDDLIGSLFYKQQDSEKGIDSDAQAAIVRVSPAVLAAGEDTP